MRGIHGEARNDIRHGHRAEIPIGNASDHFTRLRLWISCDLVDRIDRRDRPLRRGEFREHLVEGMFGTPRREDFVEFSCVLHAQIVT